MQMLRSVHSPSEEASVEMTELVMTETKECEWRWVRG